jgi:hypothetical protein
MSLTALSPPARHLCASLEPKQQGLGEHLPTNAGQQHTEPEQESERSRVALKRLCSVGGLVSCSLKAWNRTRLRSGTASAHWAAAKTRLVRLGSVKPGTRRARSQGQRRGVRVEGQRVLQDRRAGLVLTSPLSQLAGLQSCSLFKQRRERWSRLTSQLLASHSAWVRATKQVDHSRGHLGSGGGQSRRCAMVPP